MRLHLLLLAALTGAAPADAATRNFTVTGFDRVRVDGPFRVVLTTNVAPFAKASGAAAALDSLSIEVQGRTLIVRRSTAASSGGLNRSQGPVSIELGTHELAAAWINGAGGLTIDRVKGQAFDLSVAGSGAAEVGAFTVDRLAVSVSGSATVALGGSAQAARLFVTGPSSIDASALRTKTATVTAEGASTIRLHATDTVKVDARGLSTIDFSGNPACTIRPTTTAEVRGCK